MLDQLADPLAYAEALLEQFTCVGQADAGATVLGNCARAVVQLSDCELSQLYLLDATHKHLELTAEWFQGALQPARTAEVPVDYTGEQLLQFAVCQNRVITLCDLDSSLYDTDFLPRHGEPWRSLLCVPLVGAQQTVEGVLLAASSASVDLLKYAPSLGALGAFALLQQRLRQ